MKSQTLTGLCDCSSSEVHKYFSFHTMSRFQGGDTPSWPSRHWGPCPRVLTAQSGFPDVYMQDEMSSLHHVLGLPMVSLKLNLHDQMSVHVCFRAPNSCSCTRNLCWGLTKPGLGSDLQVETGQWTKNQSGLLNVRVSTRERRERPHPPATALHSYE